MTKAGITLVGFAALLGTALDARAEPRGKGSSRNKREVILLGKLNPKTILEKEPEFEKHRKRYRPKDHAVESIRAHVEKCTVRVFLGTWCDDSQKHVGRFFKTIEQAGNKRIECEYYGVDREKQDPDGLAKKHEIEKVPTFILLVGKREVGRITEKPKGRIEEDMATLLEAANEDER